MKHYVLFFLVAIMALGLGGCKKNKVIDPQMQAFIERQLANLVFVEGGTFMMGDAGREVTDEYGTRHRYWTGDPDTVPAHEVTLDSYSIQKFEVTFEEFDFFTKVTNRPIFKDYALEEPFRSPEIALAGVTWNQAKEYCEWLADVSGLPFDLPTEAQWEFAARSRGLNVGFATDTGELDLGRNYAGANSPWHTDPPGTYPPNPLGLYDMTGNAAEWVKDWYQWNYYEHSPGVNPQGPITGEEKIMRGSHVVGSSEFKLLYRRRQAPPESTDGGGIRCVVNLTIPIDHP